MVALYDGYGKLMYSIIFRAVRDEATAEDLVQETFLRVWNRIHTFDEERGNLAGWLVTIARNRAFDYLRSLRARPSNVGANWEELERGGNFVSQESDADRIVRGDAVARALESLTQDQRIVIELTHFEGLTQTEISERLQKPLGTVKGLVRSALKSLRAVATGSAAQ